MRAAGRHEGYQSFHSDDSNKGLNLIYTIEMMLLTTKYISNKQPNTDNGLSLTEKQP